MTLEFFDFWTGLALLALLACLLIYGIFDTRFELARRRGADAIALLKRNARRLRVLIVGTSIILVGIVIMPLPGPGLSVLGPIGLAILASEFVWARTLAARIQAKGAPLHEATRRIARGTPRWSVIPVCLVYWAAMVAVELWTPVPTVVLWPAASILFTPVMLWAYLVWRGSRAGDKPPDHQGTA